MDIRARAKRIKGLMGGLLRKSEHVTLTGQAIERAVALKDGWAKVQKKGG